jgi:hypothetical protein
MVQKSDKSMFVILGLVAVAFSFVATLYYIALLKPSSTLAWFVLASWLLLPHLAVGGALLARMVGPVAALILLALGQLYLADVIIWNSDPQGAIAVFMLPLFQFFGLAGAFLITRLVHKRVRAKAS